MIRIYFSFVYCTGKIPSLIEFFFPQWKIIIIESTLNKLINLNNKNIANCSLVIESVRMHVSVISTRHLLSMDDFSSVSVSKRHKASD